MAISYRKGVGTAATLIADLSTTQGGPSVIIHNNSGAPIYIGGNTVTVNDSFTLAAGSALAVTIDGSESIYGITSTTTQTIQVFRTNVAQSGYHG